MSDNPDNVPALDAIVNEENLSLEDAINPFAGRQDSAVDSTRSFPRNEDEEVSTSPLTTNGHRDAVQPQEKSSSANSTNQRSQEALIDQEEELSRAGAAWWKNAELEILPEYHPLAKTHIKLIAKDINQQTLLRCLDESFYAMSFQVKHSNDPVSADIVTYDGVEFCVFLGKSRPSENQEDEDIVLDIQHYAGDAISFKRYAQFIMEAARGRFDVQHYKLHNAQDMEIQYLKAAYITLAQENSRNNNENDAIQKVEYVHESSILGTLNKGRDLLKRGTVETQEAGMQMLCVLVNPRRTGVVTSVLASHAVLRGATSRTTGDSREGATTQTVYPEIRDVVILRIQKKEISSTSVMNHDGEEDMETKTFIKNLILALDVLINALEVVLNLNELLYRDMMPSVIMDNFVTHAKHALGVDLLSTLVFWLGTYYQLLPHIACRAATILKFVCQVSLENHRGFLVETKALDAARSAYRYGINHHARLESETMTLCHLLQAKNNEE